MKYVITNSKSLTVIPVFYQYVGEGFPVFSQESDAIVFNSVLDSLKTVYPESKYVKALEAEAAAEPAEGAAATGSAESFGGLGAAFDEAFQNVEWQPGEAN